MVAAFGLVVTNENTIINNAEMITIGTTGIKPKTAVPPGVRVRTSKPPGAQDTIAGPGAGAGTTCWKIATAATAEATKTVDASAPHLVLPLQNKAAIRSGDKAANPENAY